MSRYENHNIVITSLLFLFCFVFFTLVASQLPPTQITTMTKLFDLVNNTDSSPWKNKTQNPCLWIGVACSPNNSFITNISLSQHSLSSPEILTVSCQIDTLQSLDLSNNNFNSIPDGFLTTCGNLAELKLLNVTRNKLVGDLHNLMGFPVLEYLDFSFNKLSGSIPSGIGNLTLLKELQLSGNMFQGAIPEEIANCTNLNVIDLSGNKLSRSIPDRLGELPKLDSLILSLNNLTGEIPKSLLSIKTLSRFAANQNKFTGKIPPGMTQNLRNLDLSFNELNGSIPLDLLSLNNLQTLDLSNNMLVQSIPQTLSTSLVRLRLGSNKISGLIPRSFGNLQNLMYLELESNKLTGTIPHELGLCRSLLLLNLANNNLTGTVPVQLGNLTKLQVMKLQNNLLSGKIPVEITQLNGLQLLNISWNSLTGPIPSSISGLFRLTNLDLRQNNLNDSIPDTISSLNSLIELQLGSNQLTGVIKSMPSKLQIALNLSNNNFDGKIPSILSRLNVLEVLDLSNNKFSGEIPVGLTEMSSLTELLLSNNQLSGVVPKFKSYVTVEARGNNLINTTSNPSDAPLKKSKRKVSVGIVIAAATGVLAITVVVVIALSLSRRFYRINDVHSTSGEDIAQQEVIQGNMLTPNAIHRSNIDFALAMEAVSRPSNIVVKTRFSTYYKTVMLSGKQYFVKKLNWSEKIFQMGSNEQFREELQVLGKLNNSNVMTPLAYVLTVDSAYLFYEFAEKGTLFDFLHGTSGNDLEWASRYSIALGVAQGLAFLHGCTSGPILLLDLSSRSILLKSTKEPLIGDIELYKVIDPTKSTGSLSTIAGSVGYVPPEYAYTMRVTMAANVYSFGVILLELLSGKPAVFEGTELAKWVISKSAQQDKLDQILDFRLSSTSLAVRSQMLAILRVALTCVSISPEARPKMKSVLRMLLNAR